MIIYNVAFLASVTARSQVYLQTILSAGYIPEKCILYTDNKAKCFNRISYEAGGSYFDSEQTLIELLNAYGVMYEIVEENDINSECMEAYLKKQTQNYFIYSGYGGFILKPHLFNMGKKFIHIHAGKLPEYRGSTTAYYSILKDSCISATAIFLNEKIDEGDIIHTKSFPLPKEKVDIDYIYEPWVRAQVLKEVLEIYGSEGEFNSVKQPEEYGEIYYIIHPVLKHLAILKTEQEWKEGR